MNFTADSINWIIAVQSVGTWLEAPMRFFTFLGYENFFFLVLPLLYWSVDARVGLRVGLILVSSTALNAIFKLGFASPRPYWMSTQVQPLSMETTFGLPSAHAQNAIALWGIMAYDVRRRWAWIVAIALSFLIGLSRIYLGVHFPWDIVAGWLIGSLLLLTFITLWEPVSGWLRRKTLVQQIGVAFLVSLAILGWGIGTAARLHGFVLPQEWIANALRAGTEPNPVALEGFITAAGTFFGLALGTAWIAAHGSYQAAGPWEKRALRYVIGVIGILILWMGLGQVFPREPNLTSYMLRYLRYSFVGFWVTAGAPWLFFRFKLADQPKM